MSSHSRSTLFLIEQIIVIAVFAICAAVCIKILVISYLMTVEAVDTKNALLIAESVAESYKAFAGVAEKTAETFGGTVLEDSINKIVSIYYDNNWQPCGETEAVFILHLMVNNINESSVLFADIAVSRVTTNDELISLTVAARRER